MRAFVDTNILLDMLAPGAVLFGRRSHLVAGGAREDRGIGIGDQLQQHQPMWCAGRQTVRRQKRH